MRHRQLIEDDVNALEQFLRRPLDHLQRPQSVFSLQKALIEDVPLGSKKTGFLGKIKDYLHK